MTTVAVPIGPAGPLVDVELTLPAAALLALRAAGTPIPPPVPAVALIDTGADVTVLDPALLAPLVAAGLRVSRAHLVNAPAAGGLAPALEYRVGLTVAPVAGRPRSGLALRTFPVVERPLGPLGYQALLGRDVLDLVAFFYDGPGKRLTLGY